MASELPDLEAEATLGDWQPLQGIANDAGLPVDQVRGGSARAWERAGKGGRGIAVCVTRLGVQGKAPVLSVAAVAGAARPPIRAGLRVCWPTGLRAQCARG